MLRIFLVRLVSFCGAVPGATGSAYGLLAAADRVGFDRQFSPTHEKLANFLNHLIYLMVEYWPPYLIACAIAAFLWTLIIAEPKAVAKRKFKERRLQVRS